ncbi:MAG: hypothetical protein M0R80_26265 [Proteobacteria bacterium]|jgi:hypothetical protein|nr:hypothetical protein [Pseudomonadota bacterium]
MRSLSASVTTQYATEPIIVLKVDWDVSNIAYYGERTISWGLESVVGNILSISNLSNVNKENNQGDVSNISVTLNDTTGDLKTLSDSIILEGTVCTVYQCYATAEDIDESNVLMKGKLSGDIIWSEGERTLSFSIESSQLDGEIGFAPSETDIPGISKDTIGKMWPLCFGKPLRVPAVRLRKTTKGELQTNVTYASTTMIVEGGSDFPQDTTITIYINGIKCTGSFTGNTFTFSSKNDDYFGAPINCIAREVGDYQYNPSVLWIDDATKDLVGKFVLVNDGTYDYVNYCTKQVGDRCHFATPFRRINTVTTVLIDEDSDIEEVAGAPRTSWSQGYYRPMIYSVDLLGNVIDISSYSLIGKDAWSRIIGCSVLYNSGYSDVFVVNGMDSTDILEVLAYRDEPFLDDCEKSDRKLMPIPSSWYTINLSTTIEGNSCTTITFNKVDIADFTVFLDDKLEALGFESDLYVSVVSSVGQNVADIIQYLIETYTDYSVDAASFLVVHNLVPDYPCNFALFDKKSAIETCSEIAWQARCAMYLRNGIVFLKYLSVTPSSDLTLNNDNIILKSISLGFTTIEELVTYFTANWKSDYTGHDETIREYVYKDQTSIDRFGEKKQEYDFFIYNIESLVKISSDFWGYRYGHIWRKLTCKCILSALKLEVYDTITFDIAGILTNDLLGDVLSAGLSLPEVNLVCQLNCQAGALTQDATYYSIGSDNCPTDPSVGLDEIDYTPVYCNKIEAIDEVEKDTKWYRLVVRTSASTVTRGVNFGLVIELQDEFGHRQSKSIGASIIFQSSDSSDNDNLTTVYLVDGFWSSTSVQITGGAGQDTGSFSVIPIENAEIYKDGNSNGFTIVTVDGIDFTSCPTSAERGVAFNVVLTGPVSSQIDLVLTGGDAADTISPTHVHTDGSGGWSGTITIDNGTTDTIHKIYGNDAVSGKEGYSGDISIADDPEENYNVIGVTTEGNETADGSSVRIGDDDKGLLLHFMTRVGYWDAGDAKLYGFIRSLKIDSEGKFLELSGETRVELEIPEDCD